MEVKARSGQVGKLSERTYCMLAKKAKASPHITAKDLWEGLANTGMVMRCSTLQHSLHKPDLHRRVIGRKPYLRFNHKLGINTTYVCKTAPSKGRGLLEKVPLTDED